MAKRAPIDLQITLSRDSVCMGDDVDAPHHIALDVPVDATLASLCEGILSMGYLARIAGGQAAWVVRANQQNLAVLAQQWRRPLYIQPPDMPVKKICTLSGTGDVNIKYHQQKDPLGLAQSLSATGK